MQNKGEPFHIIAIPDQKIAGTKLNNFRIRTPENIDLNGDYEVALVESSLPFNIYNVRKDSYFCIARYNLKSKIKFRKDHQYRKCVLTGGEDWEKSPPKEFALDYAIRIRIPEGFYESVDQLKSAIQLKIRLLLDSEKNRLPASTTTDDIAANKYYVSAMDGLNPNFKEFFLGLALNPKLMEDAEARKVDALNNIILLNRMLFTPETGYVNFKKDSAINATHYFSTIKTNIETAHLLGYDTDCLVIPFGGTVPSFQVRIYPHDTIFVYVNILENTIVSGYESNILRILPIEALKPKFGNLIWTEYQNPHYVKLNTHHISYIQFELLDRFSNPINFEHTAQNIQFTLHFRPIKQGET